VKEGAAGVAFADIDVAAATKRAEDSKEYASNKDYKAIAIQVDISKKQNAIKMVDTVIENFGRIDYAANCAGVSNCPWIFIFKGPHD
jgi:NAD(P)-dependent dehydrogenase (short-subunit alcohol dehydrogenase family)